MADKLIVHNGYVAELYGSSSMNIYKNGHKKLHTGRRKANTDEEVKELLEKIPELMDMFEKGDGMDD